MRKNQSKEISWCPFGNICQPKSLQVIKNSPLSCATRLLLIYLMFTSTSKEEVKECFNSSQIFLDFVFYFLSF